MDTTYYTFQTRKIKASGGAELVSFVPSLQPDPQAREAAAPAGEVLNFDLCRRRLETRAAWKDLTAAAQSVGEVETTQEEEPIPYRPVREHGNRSRVRTRVRAPWVEILASALALGFVCLVGAVALLSIV